MRLCFFASIPLALLAGCGSTVTGSEPTDAGDAGDIGALLDTGRPDGLVPPTDSGPASPGVKPPPRPSAVAAGGTTRWYAMRKLQLGITRPGDGAADANAWKFYGYDLDSRTTTRDDSKASTNSCKRRPGSPTNVLVDGELGRDNNFGQHFMSVIKSLKADAEESVNASILSGNNTWLLRLDNVAGADNAKVPGAFYVAGPLGTTPRWDGTDRWPADANSVIGGSVMSPKLTFPSGYMAGGVWVSGEFGVSTASLPITEGFVIAMDGAVISFNTVTLGGGVVAGVSHTTKFVEGFTPFAKRFGICPGNATYDQVVNTVEASADLVVGAPLFQDTTKECNAMSIGLGFTVAPVVAPTTVITPPPPFPDECGP